MKEPETTADRQKAKKPAKEPETAKTENAVRGGKKESDAKKASRDASVDEQCKEEEREESAEEAEKDPLDALQEELALERDKYLRLAAEYDNYRKRSAKEREMMYGDARADTITRLLPVYDNLERALKMECSDEAYYKGVEMTMTQLTEIMETMGVKQIPAAGEPFDPNIHNAVLTIVDPELGEKTVAEECQKGFTLGERVIRHSTVVVAN